MKYGLTIGVALFILGVLSGLCQMWFSPWSPDVFIKIETSLGGLLLIDGVVWFAVKEHRDDKATRRGDLDG
jgi:hypothetical protein